MSTTEERPTPTGEPESDTEGHGLLVDLTYSQRKLGRVADAGRETRERRQAKETRPNRPDRE